MLCPDSKNAILRSCGAGIAAADDLMNKNERVFCAIRPQDITLKHKSKWFLFHQ